MALGRSQFLYESIRALAAMGYDIILIATSKASPEYTRNAADFEQLAAEVGADYRYFQKPSDINTIHHDCEVGISVNWHTILSPAFIQSFPKGIINAHMGDLPRYRGNACPNWAIINGEKKITITLHQMSAELDAGIMLAKAHYHMTPETYITDIYEHAETIIPRMFVDVLNSPVKGKKQFGRPLRCYPRLPSDNHIDWNQDANQIHRLIRASSHPFSGAYTHLNGTQLTIWRAHTEQPTFDYLAVPGQVLERRKDGSVAVATGDGWLIMDEYEPHIIKSHRDRLT